jgi:hypothetical protein
VIFQVYSRVLSEGTGMEREPFAKGSKAKAISYSLPLGGVGADLLLVAGVRRTVTPVIAYSLLPL